ncbi:MAG: matrixin family metalloprotease, partial [Phycisphaerales bacterium]|nr:matrixin family metalloprotease [Phycisphaerales bacterium]
GLLASLRLTGPAALVADEGNDSFAAAKSLVESDSGSTALRGEIESTTDIDVYVLAGASAGDRVQVEVTGEGYLDPAAGVFDADRNLLFLNDDRNYFAGVRDARIDFVLRHATDSIYVAVASSPNVSSSGGYTLAVAISAGDGQAPPPQRQHVLLNFDGASGIGFGGRKPVDMPRFDGAVISPTLTGMSDALIDAITEHVLIDYTGLDVVFHTTVDDIPRGIAYSTVHFGAYDKALLGVAENIDEYNELVAQDAIVFTDTFAVFNVLQPSFEEYAQALANVTSHEVGHLLGLVHTADTSALMDVSASLRQLMLDQAFRQSPLDAGTFPIGFQNAAVTLVESVGGDMELARESAAMQLQAAEPGVTALNAKTAEMIDLPRVPFATCLCRGCEAKRVKADDPAPNWPVH